MKVKIIVPALFALAFSAVLIIVLIKNIPYTPGGALSVSLNFIKFMTEGRLMQAYSLTDKKALVGLTFDDFKRKVSSQWGDRAKTGCDIKMNNISPRQSIGNMLRRLCSGKHAGVDRLYIGYHVDGIPFGINLAIDRSGKWKVMNFQVHAE